MKLYHYSDEKFDSIDMSKCDGFWMTDIRPSETEMLDEIGASSLNYVAICEITESENVLENGDNSEVEEQLLESDCDYIENMYDGFTDYAISNPEMVSITKWVKL